MDKLNMQSRSVKQDLVDRIIELIPRVATEGRDEEGRICRAVDIDALRAALGATPMADTDDEAYRFTWVGKRAAIAEAGRSITKTLRPVVEDSVDWDTTQNIYIEGDNLDALKLLQESYLGKVKMIYIDPPYNTGNDFVYNDSFGQTKQEYEDEAGVFDEENNQLYTVNHDTHPRYHSKWCSMIYPRLLLARNLLTDDGVIFISIDDNEVDNLKKMCDEIFGESNFICNVIWKRKRGRDNSAKWFSKAHEYLILYSKNKNVFTTNNLELDEQTKQAYKNPDNDPRGPYRMLGCWARGTQGGVLYDFRTKDGLFFKKREWLLSKEKLIALDKENKLIIKGDNVYRKMFIDENKGKIPETLWDSVSNAANASDEIKKIFDTIIFDTPKPIPYIREMLNIATHHDSLILDFFSGSATTAHAVMQLNAEDGGKRKFILVNLPEECPPESEAAKNGFKNICEIGKERIRRAGAKIRQEHPEAKDLDTGFRVFRVDSSNMKDVYYTPEEYTKDMLLGLVNNIKEDRTELDLLYGCLLDWGLPLDKPHESATINGVTIYTYDTDFLIACFAQSIDEKTVREIARRKPAKALFRDACFGAADARINVEEIFKSISPDTQIKVI